MTKPCLLEKVQEVFLFSLRFFVLCAAKAGAHINELADAHTHTHKGAGSTGGHPSYGKHS